MNELLETAHLSMARTKSITGCSSASDFILLEAFDADLKAPLQFGMFFVSRICYILYYSLVCFVMPDTMQQGYLKFT